MARESVLVVQGERSERTVSFAMASHAVECDGGITIRFERCDGSIYLEIGPEDAEALFSAWRRERAEIAAYLEGLAVVERSASRTGGP